MMTIEKDQKIRRKKLENFAANTTNYQLIVEASAAGLPHVLITLLQNIKTNIRRRK
jgi:hypothetical protein